MHLKLFLSAVIGFSTIFSLSAHGQVSLVFSGGHETDPRDRGRPVVLVAAGLNVSPQIFREAFSRVHPAPAGTQPGEDRTRANKTVLLAALAPYGVTNARLDEVSNYYRYNRSAGEMWRQREAAGYATLAGGKITGLVLTDGGAGYSSVPVASAAGVALPNVHVEMYWGPDLARNGSITAITIEK
jgi:hypothetical protein